MYQRGWVSSLIITRQHNQNRWRETEELKQVHLTTYRRNWHIARSMKGNSQSPISILFYYAKFFMWYKWKTLTTNECYIALKTREKNLVHMHGNKSCRLVNTTCRLSSTKGGKLLPSSILIKMTQKCRVRVWGAGWGKGGSWFSKQNVAAHGICSEPSCWRWSEKPLMV